MLKHEVEERRAHIEQLDEELERTEIERDEISEMLEEEQIKVEELSTEISLLRGRLSAVILQAVDLEAELERAKPERVLRRVLDAVNRARTECANLEFAP
jgi:septal ring factor EnvC (AmiA/AmiB activator)